MWKSVAEIEKVLESYDHRDQLLDLHALSRLWRSVFYADEYEAHGSWTSLLKLTKEGEGCLAVAERVQITKHQANSYFAIFCLFYHHDLMFDADSSDVEGIRSLLERELRERRVRLPSRFGRTLYDRFNDMDIHGRTDHLTTEQAAALLGDTPQGVYQVSYFVTGPLGVIRSTEPRYVPPNRQLPLWHCSDTGCRALHDVELSRPSSALGRLQNHLGPALKEEYGATSEWSLPLIRLHRSDKWDDGRPYYDLPVFLADAIIGQERTALLATMLKTSHGKVIREVLGRARNNGRPLVGPPDEIASKIASEDQLQALWVLDDRTLINEIDQLVSHRHIPICVGEIRAARTTPPKSANDSETELGSLGLRSSEKDPSAHLLSMIAEAYSLNGEEADLGWHICARPGAPLLQELMLYAKDREPAELLRDLIFPSRSRTNSICSQVFLDDSDLQPTAAFAQKLLWKLGFDPPQFGEFESRLQDRIKNFRLAVLQNSPIEHEEQRERIRGAGVNLFVAMEEFVDLLVTYNVWTLWSDHFLQTRFTFNPDTARHVVTTILGERIAIEETEYAWDIGKTNTLGVALTYLNAALDAMRNLDPGVRERVKRDENDLPHFADDTIYYFPFRHIQLWADSDMNALRRYVAEFGEIVRLLSQANLASIRNGLDHMRDPAQFPASDAMLACASRISEAFELADTRRYYPKVFWCYLTKESCFGFEEYEFRDYAGKREIRFGPSLASALPSVTGCAPLLLCPGELIPSANAQLYFRCARTNEYQRYWDGYPRRRVLPPMDRRGSISNGSAAASGPRLGDIPVGDSTAE